MIWDAWRRRAQPVAAPIDDAPFADLLEEAPIPALLIDRAQRILAANEAARSYFGFSAGDLPGALVELTAESRLLDLVREGRPEGEARLVHRGRMVRTRLVPGPLTGDTLLFLEDVTDLRRLETVRQEFVANLSHELRTPVTGLRLAVESLQGDLDPPTRARFIERALKEADHLAAVVDNLRRLAEIESGRLSVAPADVDLPGLVHEVVERLGLEGRVEVAFEPALPMRSDPAKLAQALGNLLENAARFAPAGSEIRVEAGREQSPPGLVLRVRDRGPGISPEHWDRVFERFYKVDPARSRGEGGTGLGLAITKHLVQAVGGQVWTEANPGGGQVFVIRLPDQT